MSIPKLVSMTSSSLLTQIKLQGVETRTKLPDTIIKKKKEFLMEEAFFISFLLTGLYAVTLQRNTF